MTASAAALRPRNVGILSASVSTSHACGSLPSDLSVSTRLSTMKGVNSQARITRDRSASVRDNSASRDANCSSGRRSPVIPLTIRSASPGSRLRSSSVRRTHCRCPSGRSAKKNLPLLAGFRLRSASNIPTISPVESDIRGLKSTNPLLPPSNNTDSSDSLSQST